MKETLLIVTFPEIKQRKGKHRQALISETESPCRNEQTPLATPLKSSSSSRCNRGSGRLCARYQGKQVGWVKRRLDHKNEQHRSERLIGMGREDTSREEAGCFGCRQ